MTEMGLARQGVDLIARKKVQQNKKWILYFKSGFNKAGMGLATWNGILNIT